MKGKIQTLYIDFLTLKSLPKEAPIVYKKLLQDYIKSGGDYKDPEIFSRIKKI